MLTLSGSLAGNRATFTNITHRTIFSSPFFERFAINSFHIRRSEKSLLTSMQFLSMFDTEHTVCVDGVFCFGRSREGLLKVHRSWYISPKRYSYAGRNCRALVTGLRKGCV